MNNIFTAEIKKTLTKPGIWILTVLIVIALVLSALFYNPAKRQDTRLQLNGSSVVDINANFNLFKSTELDNLISDMHSYLNNYPADSEVKQTLVELINNLTDEDDGLFKTYDQDCDIASISVTVLNADKTAIYNKLNQIDEYLYSQFELCELDYYFALVSSDNYTNIKVLLNDIARLFSNANPTTSVEQHRNTRTKVIENGYMKKLNNIADKIYFTTVSEQLLENLKLDEQFFLTRLNAITLQINELAADANLDEEQNLSQDNITKIKVLANQYYQSIILFNDYIIAQIKTDATKNIDANKIENLKYFENYSQYESNEKLTLHKYLFKNNKNITDYALALNMNTTSNFETNAYDFAIFAMKIISVLILSFALINAANSIAGEINSGTMKFLAIRPVSRTKIFFGKFFANFVLSLILIIFSLLIAFVIGIFLFSAGSSTILAIINASAVILVHPLIMLLIFVLSFMLELITLIFFAMLLSSLFKSNVSAIVVSLTLYFLTLILNLISNLNFMKYYPFTNLNIYNYFGYININSANILSRFLSSHINSTGSIWFPVCYIGAFSILSILIAVKVFKNREV